VTPPSIYNIWLHVAYDRGFFSDNGVDVADCIQLKGGPLAIQAMAAGEADIAPADPEGLFAAVAAGHSIRAVAAPGSRLAYMVVVRRDIETLSDRQALCDLPSRRDLAIPDVSAARQRRRSPRRH
jgi:ABC-type nitrate/sulfonate/bicarbonate transport system substrate-binding protein